MGLLKHLRSRSRLKSNAGSRGEFNIYRGPDRISRLPKHILCRIFNYVCPHTMDESYESSEKSALDDGCGLCDLKDLAQCALVNRDWYMAVQDVLYVSSADTNIRTTFN